MRTAPENHRQKLCDRPGYKWVVIASSFLMVFFCLGFSSAINKGLYMASITEVYGIKRSLFSLSDSIRYVSTSVINLFFGVLIAKFGARKLIGAGFVSLIIALLIYGNSDQLYQFYIGGMFLGIGMSWTTTSMVGYVVNCWCREKKGTIMGFILAANGVGGAIATQILTPIICSDAYGFKQAYKLITVILLVVGIVVITFMRNAPIQLGTTDTKQGKKKDIHEGISFKEALKKPYFYMTVVCVFLTGAALQGIGGVSSAHMRDVGIDTAFLANVGSIHSLVLFAAKFLAGASNDRFGMPKTVLICDVAGVIAFTALALTANTPSGRSLAMVYSVLSSLALPLETIMLPLMAEHIFGQKSFAQMMGIIVSVNTAGYAVGTPAVNLVYDLLGTYKPVLLVCAGLLAVVGIMMQGIFVTVKKERNLI